VPFVEKKRGQEGLPSLSNRDSQHMEKGRLARGGKKDDGIMKKGADIPVQATIDFGHKRGSKKNHWREFMRNSWRGRKGEKRYGKNSAAKEIRKRGGGANFHS